MGAKLTPLFFEKGWGGKGKIISPCGSGFPGDWLNVEKFYFFIWKFILKYIIFAYKHTTTLTEIKHG